MPPGWSQDHRPAGVSIASGVIANTLIYNCHSGLADAENADTATVEHIGGIYAKGSAKVINCTVVDCNVGNGLASGIYAVENARVYNSVASNAAYPGNKAPTLAGTAAHFITCASDDAEKISDSSFAAPAAGLFRQYVTGDMVSSRLTPSEMLKGKGTMEISGYAFPESDLAGNARIKGLKVDIGAFEGPEAGVVITIF